MQTKFNYLSHIKEKKNILICPLDWGLGHAARCVPIINELLRLNFNVIIAADNKPLHFLQQEFPYLQTIILPGCTINYAKRGNFLKLLLTSFKFNKFIKKEHQFIDSIIRKHHIDIIISDNRYGVWSKNIKSIIITHQPYPKTPIASLFVHQKIKKLMNNFDEVWIPDVAEKNNFSGDLAHLKPLSQKHYFIGSLSRFSSLKEIKTTETDSFDIIAILSGPEPQRTIFERKVLAQIEQLKLKAVIVRGLPNSKSLLKVKAGNIKIFNHLPTKKLQQYIIKSNVVVCRAGYSSIMDLIALNKKGILIPTPAQTEQEYLAKYHFRKNNFYTQKQSRFNLKEGLEKIEQYHPKFEQAKKVNLDTLL